MTTPLHLRLQSAGQDTAVITLSDAAVMLVPPEPDPFNDVALQADSDPKTIQNLSNNLSHRTFELTESYNDFRSAVSTMATAWRGRRHQAWNSLADAVLEYYSPSGLRGGKSGVLTLSDQTARATAAIGADLDTATTAVANALMATAGAVFPSAEAVTQQRATPEDELAVRQAVMAVTNSLVGFEQLVTEIDKNRLIDPGLDQLLEFPEGAGMPNDPTEDNLLTIQFPQFEGALKTLNTSASLVKVASDGFNGANTINGPNGQSPFGPSSAAVLLEVNWVLTVSWRAAESADLQVRIKQLEGAAEQAEQEYLAVEQRNTNSFRVIYPD
jgi:hypothetical protein